MNSAHQLFSQQTAVRLALLVPGLMLLSGCVVEERRPIRHEVYVEAPPPRPVETVVIDVPPPPPQEEIIIAQPSPEHIWVRGYWVWQGGRHAWLAGHWELPPRRGCVWVEPRWEHHDRGYVFMSGAWRDGPVVVKERVVARPAVTVGVNLNFVLQPPPPPRREVIVERERPSREHVWIKGYYVWREGRHVWREGHWERPPHPHAVWIEPRWEHHDRGYVFVEGVWR